MERCLTLEETKWNMSELELWFSQKPTNAVEKRPGGSRRRQGDGSLVILSTGIRCMPPAEERMIKPAASWVCWML